MMIHSPDFCRALSVVKFYPIFQYFSYSLSMSFIIITQLNKIRARWSLYGTGTMKGFLWRKGDKQRRGVSYRQTIEARVDISHSHFGTLHALTRDISDSGIFVLLNEIPHLPKGAHLRVKLPESANPEITFNMRVVRTTEEGVALTFVDYEQDGERHDMAKLLKKLGK